MENRMNIKQQIDSGGEVMARNPDIEVEVLKTDTHLTKNKTRQDYVSRRKND
jgi:hypothetical protein